MSTVSFLVFSGSFHRIAFYSSGLGLGFCISFFPLLPLSVLQSTIRDCLPTGVFKKSFSLGVFSSLFRSFAFIVRISKPCWLPPPLSFHFLYQSFPLPPPLFPLFFSFFVTTRRFTYTSVVCVRFAELVLVHGSVLAAVGREVSYSVVRHIVRVW